MKDIDAVPSNVQSACQEVLLCVFEDNEAVNKMIIKGRSPIMRHVSRTHRVALDAKRAQQESGEERVTAKIATYDELDRKNTFGRVIFSFLNPGEDLVWISRA